MTQKHLFWSLLIFTATFASINAEGSGNFLELDDRHITTTSPFSRLNSVLDKFNWDPVTIENFVHEYWHGEAKLNFTKLWKNHQGEEITILNTICHYTAPWVLVALMGLETRPYHGVHLPQNPELAVYHNIPLPPSLDAASPAQSMRDFINSRPSDESILLQIDLQEYLDHHSTMFHDHHFMIHSYDGKISLYQSWVGEFSLLTWMREAFNSRYPMDKETFLYHYEKVMTMPKPEEHDLKLERDESAWAILGRTNTLEYYTTKTGEKRVDDIAVKLLHLPFYTKLITHWPNAGKDIGEL